MKPDWSPLLTELSIWRAQGLHLPIWWRDDDAVDDTPELRKLLTLSDKLSVPVHLAVIPEPATTGLRDLCADHPATVALVHGWCHRNHAPDGAKRAEFGHPRNGTTKETQAALTRLRDLFGTHVFEMFVPPWNRVDDSVVAALKSQGYRALSTYGPRPARQVAGLVRINTHIDPIHWKAGGGLVPPEQVIAGIIQTLQARRSGKTDPTEPLGFLSHHLVHDTAIWDFTERCLSVLLDGGATACSLPDTTGIA